MAFEALILFFQIIFSYWRTFFISLLGRNPKDLSGEVVLVTGAGGGIGRCLALEFAKQGAKLVLWDINKKANEDTASMVNDGRGFARAYQCDVTSIDNIQSVSGKVRQEVGDVTVLVNNAGVLPARSILNLSEAQIRTTIEVNLLSHFWTIREFLPHMLKKNHGHIVETSSIAGWIGAGNMTDYCASKYGVRGLTMALFDEFRQLEVDGIKLTCVCPMVTDTGLMTNLKVQQVNPLTPVQTPEQVAQLTVDGMRKNELFVFVPPMLKAIAYTESIIPLRAKRKAANFHDVRIFDKRQGDLRPRRAKAD